MIYAVSDSHFFHENSLKYTGRERFHSVEEMNAEIVKRWNEVIDNNDTVYHLGDVFLSHSQEAKELLRGLKGYKILIRGNHDDKSDQWYYNAGFNEVHRRLDLISPTHPAQFGYILTHIPVPYWEIESLEQQTGRKIVNLHGHLHLVTDRTFTGDDVWEHPNSYENFSLEARNFCPTPIYL